MEHASRKQFGPFVFDGKERVLSRDGQPVPLTPKGFDLLGVFVERPGRLLTKDELLRIVWPDTFVEESNLAYHVFALRRALGETTGNGQFIETVPKHGYRFTATVTDIEKTCELPASQAPLKEGVFSVPSPTVSWSARLGMVGLVVFPVIALYLVGWSSRGSSDLIAQRARPVTSLTGAVRAPSLSPDGRYVVFSWTSDMAILPEGPM